MRVNIQIAQKVTTVIFPCTIRLFVWVPDMAEQKEKHTGDRQCQLVATDVLVQAAIMDDGTG